MSKVQRSFAVVYQQLMELGCTSAHSGDIQLGALKSLFENRLFTDEMAQAGYDVPRLQTELGHLTCGETGFVSRGMLARLVTACWRSPCEQTSRWQRRNSEFGELGQSLWEVRNRVNFREVTLSEAFGTWVAQAEDFVFVLKILSGFQFSFLQALGEQTTEFSGTFQMGSEDLILFHISNVMPPLATRAGEEMKDVAVRCKIKSDWEAKVWKLRMMWPMLDGDWRGEPVPAWPEAKTACPALYRLLEFRKKREKRAGCMGQN